MFIHEIDPVFLSIGFLEIRYYGLVYAIGFLTALMVLLNASKKKKIKNLDKEKTYDFVFWLMLGSIICARLFFELIYNLKSFISFPAQFFYFWEGGMSFHGGITGAVIAAYYFAKRYKISFYRLADILVIPFVFMLAIGRIANFINGELWGKVTGVWWAVKFPGADGYRHPSQLYEVAKNFFIFGILIFLKSFKLKDGALFWIFIGMYGFLRFFVTFYREAEYYFLSIGIGQWLSIIMVPIAGFMLFRIYKE